MTPNLSIRSPLADAPWLWKLEDRQAATLLSAAVPRWLLVEDGCLWVTARVAGPDADDIWLTAGQSLALPVGSEWVVEAWPQAQLRLMVGTPVVPVRPAFWAVVGGGFSPGRWLAGTRAVRAA